jgi:hypothetical protein
MAKLTAKLTLVSTDISTQESLSLSAENTLTVVPEIKGVSQITITTADDQELVDEAVSGIRYFYAKNLDTTNFIVLKTTANVTYSILSPGEFAFFPIQTGVGLEAKANDAPCVLEYAYFTKG